MPSALQKTLFLSLGILIAAWLLPNHYFPWTTAYQEFLSFSACLIFLFSLTFCKHVYIPNTRAIIFVTAAAPLAQYFFGSIYFFGDAWLATAYITGLFISIIAGHNFYKHHRHSLTENIASAFLLGAFASLFIAIYQWLLLSSTIWIIEVPLRGRPFANLAQPNNLATLLCIGLASALHLYEKDRLGRLTAGILAALLIFGIVLTQSRTPWISSLAAIFFLVWKAKTCRLRLSLTMTLGWFFFYIALVLLLPKLSELLFLSSSNPLERAQSLERLALWHLFWQAVLQGPLWGYGWNQVSVAQVSMAVNHPAPIMVEHSHNILLDLLIWNGPLLGSVIIFSASWWLLKLYWNARSTESLFALLSTGFVLTHAMLEFPLEYAFFLFPVGLLLGIATAEHSPARKFEIPRPASISIAIAGALLFVLAWREYRIIEEDYRLMRFETARIGSIKAEHLAPDVKLLTQLREFVRFARTEAREGMNDSELEWMRKVAHRYPYPPSLFRYALTLGLNGKPEGAYEQMLILRSMHPTEHYLEATSSLKQLQKEYPQLEPLNRMLAPTSPLGR